MFLTMVCTMLPAIQFAGMINPVSSLEGGAALIGRIYPASHFLTISRGVFSKALSFGDLSASFFPLFLSAPFILWVAIFLLKKQER
jgi:ribosome-dependent ATPase